MKSLLVITFLYLLIKIIFSIITVEIFIQGISIDAQIAARITAIFSIIFSTIFNWLLVNCMLLIVWYGTNLFLNDLKINMFIPAFYIFFVTLIASEILKFGFVWMFLTDELTNIDATSEYFIQQIEQTNFHRYVQMVDTLIIIISALLFGIELRQKLVPKLIITSFFLVTFFLVSLL